MSEASDARVSVVITTYQRADLVRRALASVLRQTWRDLEIVVVDDGSTDGTAEVVAGIAADAGRSVRYVWKENGGCASARNTGAAHASGRWLLFLDSDDELEPGAIEALHHAANASGADFVYSPALEVDSAGTSRLNPPVAAERPERFAVEHFSATNLRTGSYLLRTSDFHELGGFDESFSHNEDSDFVQRLAIRRRAAYSPVPSVRCHAHPGSKSRDRIAIYRALLASSERTLSRHPEFAAALGTAAAARIRDLRSALAEELIRAGRIEEARTLLDQGSVRLGPLGRFALRTGFAAPLRFRIALQAHARAFIAGLRRRLAGAPVRSDAPPRSVAGG